MKAYVQKLMVTAVLGLALIAISIPAWAGNVYLYGEVQIASDDARGSMAGARYSTDSQQYIGCNNSYGPFVTCSARDKTGKYFTCTSTDANWLATVKAMTDFSYIIVKKAPGTTSCNYLQVTNSSIFLR